MKVDMQMNRDRILVQVLKESDTFRGTNLVTPDTAKKPRRGLVLAVGPGLLTANGVIVPIAYGPGDIVMFSPHAGTEIQVLDAETERLEYVLVLRDDEILGSSPPEPERPRESFDEFRARMLAEGKDDVPGAFVGSAAQARAIDALMTDRSAADIADARTNLDRVIADTEESIIGRGVIPESVKPPEIQ